MRSKVISFFLFFLIINCAQVTSLNLQKHQFGKIPTKIIWIQVAGLSFEHIAMLKYSYPSSSQLSPFEEALCVGNAWEYNLYQMRPPAYNSFLSQLTGKKNIKGDCSDYDQKPIWKYIAPKNYKIGIFEGETQTKDSLLQSLTCKKDDFIEDAIFWSMNKPVSSKSETFHVNEKTNFKPDNVYYDKSCASGDCFSTFSRNVESIFNEFSKNTKNYLFVVRNFQYQKYLLSKDLKQAREELDQLATVLKRFQVLARKNNDVLVLLTSAESYEIEFPRAGVAWKRFENHKTKLSTQNSKLLSPVLVNGARAENFCGFYDQSQVMTRIFSGAKQQGLEFSIINPFE
ncbi:MAG: hypothetical protein CME62_08330 [Halobacteriovoraceae bacterium]|nr:hypothetical protein [Halobacteriovoraceae bacterium]|tara:strand:+ start:1717 stop:2745 length:1029 start_codon:yes stop_codon:yes gene_type:complete